MLAMVTPHISDGTLAKARGACNNESQTIQFLIEALFAPDHATLIQGAFITLSAAFSTGLPEKLGRLGRLGRPLPMSLPASFTCRCVF